MDTFVTQIVNLARAASGWLAIITIPVVATMFGWHAFARGASQDEHAAMQHSRAMSNTLKYGALVFAASGLVSGVLSFFK